MIVRESYPKFSAKKLFSIL